MRELISRKRALHIIGRMRGRRLGVLGDWMLDRYVWGTANRISPEAAVPVVDFVKESDCLGGAGNVAANLAALAARVEGFGVTGRDDTGLSLLKRMREAQISEKGILKDASRRTTVKTRIIARQQQIVRVDREDTKALSDKHTDILLRSILRALPKLNAIVISDYDKGVVTDSLTEQVLKACARWKVPVFIKPPKWSRLKTYRGATVVAINRDEAEFLVTDKLETEEVVRDVGQKLLEYFGSTAVVITRGNRGLNLFEQDGAQQLHVPARNRELPMGILGKSPAQGVTEGRQVFDVTGAGDTVLATMALAAASGATLREAAVIGNAAAGVVVGKLGTATLTRDELGAALRE